MPTSLALGKFLKRNDTVHPKENENFIKGNTNTKNTSGQTDLH
jgi:hypothetical protein